MADPVKEFKAYRQELLDLLGDDDPVEVLEATATVLEARLSELDGAELGRKPDPDTWSVKEVIGHLGDTEWVYGYRLRVMLTHESPPIPGYDQDLMVVGMVHNDRPLGTLLSEFQALRGLNLDLYRRTRGPLWERVGQHSERGEESVGLSVRLLAGHDRRHMQQIERILDRLDG